MKIGAPKEVFQGEARVAMTPDSAVQLQKLGHECVIETGAGTAAGFSDAAYRRRASKSSRPPPALWKAADVVAKVRPPEPSRGEAAGDGQTLISFFYPAQNEELLELCTEQGATVDRDGHGAAHLAARRRWTRCRRWPTSPATAR